MNAWIKLNENDYIIEIHDNNVDLDDSYIETIMSKIQYRNVLKSLINATLDDGSLDESKLIYKMTEDGLQNVLVGTIHELASKLGNIESLEEYISHIPTGPDDKKGLPIKIPEVRNTLEMLSQLPDKLFTKIISMIANGIINIWDFEPILSKNEKYESLIRSTLKTYIDSKKEHDNSNELSVSTTQSIRDLFEDIVLSSFKNDYEISNILNHKLPSETSVETSKVIDNILIFPHEKYYTVDNIDKIKLISTDYNYLIDNGLSLDEFKKIKSLTNYLYNRTNLKFGIFKTKNIKYVPVEEDGENIILIQQEDPKDIAIGYTAERYSDFKLSYEIDPKTDIKIVLTTNNNPFIESNDLFTITHHNNGYIGIRTYAGQHGKLYKVGKNIEVYFKTRVYKEEYPNIINPDPTVNVFKRISLYIFVIIKSDGIEIPYHRDEYNRESPIIVYYKEYDENGKLVKSKSNAGDNVLPYDIGKVFIGVELSPQKNTENGVNTIKNLRFYSLVDNKED